MLYIYTYIHGRLNTINESKQVFVFMCVQVMNMCASAFLCHHHRPVSVSVRVRVLKSMVQQVVNIKSHKLKETNDSK